MTKAASKKKPAAKIWYQTDGKVRQISPQVFRTENTKKVGGHIRFSSKAKAKIFVKRLDDGKDNFWLDSDSEIMDPVFEGSTAVRVTVYGRCSVKRPIFRNSYMTYISTPQHGMGWFDDLVFTSNVHITAGKHVSCKNTLLNSVDISLAEGAVVRQSELDCDEVEINVPQHVNIINARIGNSTTPMFFMNVGSEDGTLVAYMDKAGELIISRGCFSGAVGEFLEAVKKTHGDSLWGKQYPALIRVIKATFKDRGVIK